MEKRTCSLEELIPEWVAEAYSGIRVSAVCQDSRQIEKDALFMARSGLKFKGVDFIDEAVKKGAQVVLLDENEAEYCPECSVPVVFIPQLAEKMSLIAGRFYGEPSKALRMIGVTGTNGKTSCAHFLAQIMNGLGTKTAIIGTVGNGFISELKSATHTTPDAVGLQALLFDLKNQGAEAVVMEVSSHALDQGRVASIDFDCGLFTNLTRDHLDYHGTMQAYAESKTRLFTDFDLSSAIFNVDDPAGLSLSEDKGVRGNRVGVGRMRGEYRISAYRLGMQGIDAEMSTPCGALSFSCQVMGEFNLDNLLLVVAALLEQGYERKAVEKEVSCLVAVPGRMEVVSASVQDKELPVVIIDYAHTPDALEKVLQTLRSHTQGALWCVFGCGGDRDQGKREEMGKIADQLADHIILTNDNPRHESAEKIISMIKQGVSKHQPDIVAERQDAIEKAIQQAGQSDLVLIAGKGHEDYQEVGDMRYPFSDLQVCHSIMEAVA